MFGTRTLAIGHTRLPGGDGGRAGEDEEQRRRGRDAKGVAAGELRSAIAERVGRGEYRQAAEKAADVGRQLLDRAVAALRRLAERLQHDRVEVVRRCAGRDWRILAD